MDIQNKPKLLVVAPDKCDQTLFLSVPEYEYSFVSGWPGHWRPEDNFDVLEYMEKCREKLKSENFTGIVSTHDLSDLLCAVLAEEHGLPGTNPNAVFRCLHKTYTRASQPDPIQYHCLEFDKPLRELEYPCYTKPPWLKLSILGFRVSSAEQMQKILTLAQSEYQRWTPMYYPLFERYIHDDEFPLARVNHMLAEPCIEAPQVTVEGWVDNTGANLWAITDTNSFTDQPQVFDNFSFPSRHSKEIQNLIWEKTVELLTAVDFDYGFFNAEFWISDNSVQLIEINGRSAASFDGLYRRCLDASVYQGIAELGVGRTLSALPKANGTVGGQFNLITFTTASGEELIDFSAAEKFGVSVFVTPDQSVRPMSALGSVLGQVELFGRSYEEIHAQAEAIRRAVLKRPDDSPRNEPITQTDKPKQDDVLHTHLCCSMPE